MPTQPHPPTPPPGKGPTQRRYTATVNAARHAGDLEALDVLQDAMAQARRQAIDTHTSTDQESVAVAALALCETWRAVPDHPGGAR
jgi:hypothetical protein